MSVLTSCSLVVAGRTGAHVFEAPSAGLEVSFT